MKHVFSRLLCTVLTLAMLAPALPVRAESSPSAIQAALQAEIERWGDYHTWSFEKKADFYNTHVYHGTGPRRGVPCPHVLQRDMVVEAAMQYLLTEAGKTEAELAGYIIDVDYWINAWPDEEREHEYYSVLFAAETAPHQFRSAYQLTLSPYTGEVIDMLDLNAMRE